MDIRNYDNPPPPAKPVLREIQGRARYQVIHDQLQHHGRVIPHRYGDRILDFDEDIFHPKEDGVGLGISDDDTSVFAMRFTSAGDQPPVPAIVALDAQGHQRQTNNLSLLLTQNDIRQGLSPTAKDKQNKIFETIKDTLGLEHYFLAQTDRVWGVYITGPDHQGQYHIGSESEVKLNQTPPEHQIGSLTILRVVETDGTYSFRIFGRNFADNPRPNQEQSGKRPNQRLKSALIRKMTTKFTDQEKKLTTPPVAPLREVAGINDTKDLIIAHLEDTLTIQGQTRVDINTSKAHLSIHPMDQASVYIVHDNECIFYPLANSTLHIDHAHDGTIVLGSRKGDYNASSVFVDEGRLVANYNDVSSYQNFNFSAFFLRGPDAQIIPAIQNEGDRRLYEQSIFTLDSPLPEITDSSDIGSFKNFRSFEIGERQFVIARATNQTSSEKGLAIFELRTIQFPGEEPHKKLVFVDGRKQLQEDALVKRFLLKSGFNDIPDYEQNNLVNYLKTL